MYEIRGSALSPSIGSAAKVEHLHILVNFIMFYFEEEDSLGRFVWLSKRVLDNEPNSSFLPTKSLAQSFIKGL